jgi:4-aminobutyrate aminotransferase-like enzyme/Ser/Thr protein kinase RdoA (MazF antagonist)
MHVHRTAAHRRPALAAEPHRPYPPRVNRQPPPFSTQDAARIAAELYGLQVRAEPLPADRDRNFRLLGEGGGSFVLKVFRADEDPAFLAGQEAALDRLAGAELSVRVPRIRPDLDGRRVSRTQSPDGTSYLVRVVDWLPGRPMASARPHTPELLEEVGRVMGQVSRGLDGFLHPGLDRTFDWDLRQAGPVVDRLLSWIEDEDRQALVRHLRERFGREVEDRGGALPQATVHGDANDHNLLVEVAAADPDRPLRLCGLLDFGDMVHSWRVAELAVAGAYSLLGRRDPVGALAQVARGFHTEVPLTTGELDLLLPLTTMRLCVSVAQSARRGREEPDNPYLTVSQAPAWRALALLARQDLGLARARIRSACGLPAHEAVAVWASWLASREASGHPVLEGPVDSQAPDPASPEAALHDRARWVPHGRPPGTVPADPVPEPRSVHLGVDLFAPVGTPVRAPLEGRIVAVESLPGDPGAPEPSPSSVQLLVRLADPPEELAAGAALHLRLAGLAPAPAAPLRVGDSVSAGQRLGTVAGAPCPAWEPGSEARPGPPAPVDRKRPHLHVQLVLDPGDLGPDFPVMVPPSQRAVWTSLSPEPGPILGLTPSSSAEEGTRAEALLERRARVLGPTLSTAYRRPLHIVRGWMQHLYDADGRAYLDGVNNVAHVGHEHPRVVAALARQAARLNTNTRYLHEKVLEYAERLAGLLPDPLSVCTFVCSGSEANELALRMALTHTRRRSVLVQEGAYHGNTSTLVEMSPYKYRGPGGWGPGPGVHELPRPDSYRGRYRGSGPDAGARYAAHVEEALARAEADGGPVAAFFCEALPGCAGQLVPPDGYLSRAFELVRRAGGVCVADEVQTGFGRMGDHMWAFQTQGVVPDIVTLGKPMGNGHPMGAVVTTPAVAASFRTGMEYFNTFGGNPVSAAVGLAVLDVLLEEGLPARAAQVGRRLQEGLADLMEHHPLVGDVRGHGLFLGVELVLDRETRRPATRQASYVVERMREHRILLSTDGPDANVLKLKPPLVFDGADADRLVEILDQVLGEDPLQV